MTSRETSLNIEREYERHDNEVCDLERRREHVYYTMRRFDSELEQMYDHVVYDLRHHESAEMTNLLNKTRQIADTTSWEAHHAVRREQARLQEERYRMDQEHRMRVCAIEDADSNTDEPNDAMTSGLHEERRPNADQR